MIKMTLCPNCRTIQRTGTACTVCKYLVGLRAKVLPVVQRPQKKGGKP